MDMPEIHTLLIDKSETMRSNMRVTGVIPLFVDETKNLMFPGNVNPDPTTNAGDLIIRLLM